MTDFNKWPWVGEWRCAGCDADISTRWKKWSKSGPNGEDLWEFLSKCPTCGSCVMIEHYTPVQIEFTEFKPPSITHAVGRVLP